MLNRAAALSRVSIACLALLPLAAAASTLLAPRGAHAEFMAPRLKNVPIARLLTNVDAELAKRPGDVELLFRAARLHAIAWAIAGEEVALNLPAGDERLAPSDTRLWLGYKPPNVPFAPLALAATKRAPAQMQQLDQAIRLYRMGLELGGTDIERLGLGYCLLQTGRSEDRASGIRILRVVGDRAWALEMGRTEWGLGDYGVAWEAAGYLAHALDPQKDAKELAELEARRSHVEALPRPITPIVVPLVDGLTLADATRPEARAAFDLDASGRAIQWGWTSPRAAWLAYDADGSGTIDSGYELIGARTFDAFWPDGFAVLATLDDDHDGWLAGAELRGLVLWDDANGDGNSDPGELTPVAQHVRAIATRATAQEADGTLTNPAGLVMEDGHTRPLWDWLAPPAL